MPLGPGAFLSESASRKQSKSDFFPPGGWQFANQRSKPVSLNLREVVEIDDTGSWKPVAWCQGNFCGNAPDSSRHWRHDQFTKHFYNFIACENEDWSPFVRLSKRIPAYLAPLQ